MTVVKIAWPAAKDAYSAQLHLRLQQAFDLLRPGNPIGTLAYLLKVQDGWLACDGGEFLKAAHPTLARMCGTTFGSASSDEYCRLPNLTAPTGFTAVIKT